MEKGSSRNIRIWSSKFGVGWGLTTPRKTKSYGMLHRASGLDGFCGKIQAPESTSKRSIILRKNHGSETSEKKEVFRIFRSYR
jgi:hypothetical protein